MPPLDTAHADAGATADTQGTQLLFYLSDAENNWALAVHSGKAHLIEASALDQAMQGRGVHHWSHALQLVPKQTSTEELFLRNGGFYLKFQGPDRVLKCPPFSFKGPRLATMLTADAGGEKTARELAFRLSSCSYAVRATDSAGTATRFATLVYEAEGFRVRLDPYTEGGFHFNTIAPAVDTEALSVSCHLTFPAPTIGGATYSTFAARLGQGLLSLRGELEGYGEGAKKAPVHGDMLSTSAPQFGLFDAEASPPVPSAPLTYAAEVPQWAMAFSTEVSALRRRGQMAEPPMSATLLYAMPPPNNDQLASKVMTDLIAAAWSVFPEDQAKTLKCAEEKMKYSMPAYLKDFVDQSQARKDILIELLTMQFCPGMYSDLTVRQWAPEFTTKLAVQQRVQYYLQGNDKTCMSGKPAFGEVYNFILNYQYGQLAPELKPYLAGLGGKTQAQWAQELYEYATDPERAQADATTDASNQVVKKNSHTLSCLTDAYFPDANTLAAGEKRKTTLSERYAQVISGQMKDLARMFASTLSVDNMKDVITRVLVQMWEYSQNMDGDLAKMFKEAYAELQIRRASGIALELKGLIDELATAWSKSASRDPCSWSRIAAWLAKESPKFSAGLRAFWTFVGTACSTVIAAIGVVYLVEDWDSIDTEWKAFFVVSSFYHVLRAIKGFIQFGIDAKKWWATCSDLIADGSMDRMMNKAQSAWVDIKFEVVKEDAGEEVAKTVFENFESFGKQEPRMGVLAEKLPEQIGQQSAKLGKFCKYFARFAELVSVVGYLAAVLCAIVLVLQIIGEWNTETKGLLTLDILAAVSAMFEGGAIFATLAGAEISMLGIANIIPIVGQVAAVLGLIFFAVAAAIRAHRLNPVQLWVKDDGKPKLEVVNVPSREWLDKHPAKYDAVTEGVPRGSAAAGGCADEFFGGLARALSAEADKEQAVESPEVKACCSLWPF